MPGGSSRLAAHTSVLSGALTFVDSSISALCDNAAGTPIADTPISTTPILDTHDTIRVISARENNLRDVPVEIPKRRLTVFTGVSGSGKSSLVFGTIAAESQRPINATYSAFLQGLMAGPSRPDVDVMEGPTTAIIVDQERMRANSRCTVRTATDANATLRILFSRLGEPQALCFNVASATDAGALKVGDRKVERREFTITGGMYECCGGSGAVTDIALGELYEAPTKVKLAGINMTFEDLIPKVQKSMLSKNLNAMQPRIRAFVERAVTFTACPACGGTRLNDGARSSKIRGHNIAEVCAIQISELAERVRGIDNKNIAPLLANLQQGLDSFV